MRDAAPDRDHRVRRRGDVERRLDHVLLRCRADQWLGGRRRSTLLTSNEQDEQPAHAETVTCATVKPWQTLAQFPTSEGPLELRQRDAGDFMLVIGGRVLMTSRERRSETRLATLACSTATKRVLIGGLGMGYTLRAALDAAPNAQIDVAELSPEIIEWCQGPLAELTAGAASDPRTHLIVGDVARVIGKAPSNHYDAILLDLYEGPHAASQHANDPFYSASALAKQARVIAPGGTLAVWSEDPDDGYLRRFRSAGFTVNVDRSGSSRVHVVYLGIKQR